MDMNLSKVWEIVEDRGACMLQSMGLQRIGRDLETEKQQQQFHCKRVTGRKARGLQMEEIGCKCQIFALKILYCHDDIWFHLNLTFLKPWANQCIFLKEMFFLSYVNETMYLLWNWPFFKIVPPKTNFFSFLKPWADSSSTNQYSYQLFYGWGMTHFMPSYLKNAHCGRGAWWNSISLEVSLLSDQ